MSNATTTTIPVAAPAELTTAQVAQVCGAAAAQTTPPVANPNGRLSSI